MVARNVTFSVQLGSGAFQIAREVSRRLDYWFYDWEVTQKAAERAGVTPEAVAAAERAPSTFQRLAERFMLAGHADDALLYYPPSSEMLGAAITRLTSDDYRHFIESVVIEIGREGNAVIVGHTSQMALKDRRDTLKVLIVGSDGERISRLASDEKIPISEARSRLSKSDEERGQFFKRFYHIDWLDPQHYDLVLNTDHADPEAAVDLIVSAANNLLESSEARIRV